MHLHIPLLSGYIVAGIMALSVSCKRVEHVWTAPDTASIPHNASGELIRYGRELIVHTAVYLGPGGRVATISNGMNCQNCHLEAGTKFMGNNYAATAANYPRYRERSGTIESLDKRINDCLIRSLNGSPLDRKSHEMQAMIAYIEWVGMTVNNGAKPPGSGIRELPYLLRAADTSKGRLVFESQCKECHGADGAGKYDPLTKEYVYPPLWGPHSYNNGAGIFRLSKFAGYVKDNMPLNKAHLRDEEAWDVAAFVNSQPRTEKLFEKDWPDVNTKPPDVATVPFADTFSAVQHKYGPFGVIVKSRKKH
ncbi:thiosulfate dehydrogenase [Chitinophaga sp. YR627]|uniref:c-type cytochrome n=1 Tax=Chitinophaga sp. YR627 TaxID=1881041 RepID=UPI0008F36A83|nr:c-type cytochrome [Chitinophaga sp. YR627]SFN20677.1 thiosulfate dehydrogenase [Chitinophaga sp. YR627]